MSYFIKKKIPNCFPKWPYHFSFPPSMNDSFVSSPALCIIGPYRFSLSSGYVVIVHCAFEFSPKSHIYVQIRSSWNIPSLPSVWNTQLVFLLFSLTLHWPSHCLPTYLLDLISNTLPLLGQNQIRSICYTVYCLPIFQLPRTQPGCITDTQ